MSSLPLSETADKRRIGDILLAQGFVTAEQLADAELEQQQTQQPLGQVLVSRGAITRLELASALAEQWSDPSASISSTQRAAPSLVPLPSAQDEAQYAARLQEAVADLARKVQSDRPLEGIDERVEELSRRIEGTLARTQHIEAAVATLAESLEGVTTGVEEALYALQTGTAELVTDLARIEQTVAEIAARDVPRENGPALEDIDELRLAVAGLTEGATVTAELTDRVNELAGRLDALADPRRGLDDVTGRVEHIAEQLDALRSTANLDELQSTVRDLESQAQSFGALEERLAEGVVTPDELRRSIESALSERDAPLVAESVAELTGEVAMLRAEVASLLENREHATAEDGRLEARLADLERARFGDLDTVNVLAVAMDRIRHDLSTAKPQAEGQSAEELEAVSALAERVGALESVPVAAPLAESEFVSELDSFRVVLERIAVHVDEHDRAIADLAPSRNLHEQLQELAVLVQDLAEAQQAAAAQLSTGAAVPISDDIGTLLQRVEEAEAASQTDAERLMNRLEKMASSMDWRLQRLETDDTNASD